MNYEEIAKSICTKNEALVTFIMDNEGENYEGVKSALKKKVRAIGNKYNDDKFVSNNDLHQLTWACINFVEDEDVDGLDIEI